MTESWILSRGLSSGPSRLRLKALRCAQLGLDVALGRPRNDMRGGIHIWIIYRYRYRRRYKHIDIDTDIDIDIHRDIGIDIGIGKAIAINENAGIDME